MILTLNFVHFYVMTSTCVKCKQPITAADGAFFVADKPYYAAMHRRCAPFFIYDGEWPHPYPNAYYLGNPQC